MDSILKKVSEGDTRKKIQLLTLVPQSCSHRTIAHFIGVLGYTVSESRELFRKSGILGYIEYKIPRHKNSEINRLAKNDRESRHSHALLIRQN